MISRGYVRTSSVQVHYRSAGVRRTSELPVVLLHQTASSSIMFEKLMGLLSDSAWLFAPDTPGFGGTDALAEVGSVEAYARVLLEAMDRMEIGACQLFGHHSGASIAVEMAYRYPERFPRLALSGPPLLTKAQLEALVPSVSPVTLQEDGSHLMSVWKRIRAKDPTAPVELSHREAVLNLLAGVRYPEAYNAVFAHDMETQLRGLRVPTLVMVGEQDTIRASAEPATKLLQDGRLVVFPQGGTYICDREPELVAGALRDFFCLTRSSTEKGSP